MKLIKNNHEITSIRKIILPEEYQQVEYIESTGTQYINTNVTLNQDYSVLLDFQLTVNESKILFGSRRDSSTRTYTFNIGSYSSGPSPQFLGAYGNGAKPTNAAPDLNRHTIYRNKRALYFDGSLTNTSSAQTFTTPNTAYLFACFQTGDGAYLKSKFKCYKLQIWDNSDILIRYMIPCYKKSNDSRGLYDVVNNVFYTNQGSGTFVKGNDIEQEITKIYKGNTLIYEK